MCSGKAHKDSDKQKFLHEESAELNFQEEFNSKFTGILKKKKIKQQIRASYIIRTL